MKFETFRTKKRDFSDLTHIMKVDDKSWVPLSEEFYEKIIASLQKKKTDGVILIHDNGKKQVGTVTGSPNSHFFAPFKGIGLEEYERAVFDQVDKDNAALSK